MGDRTYVSLTVLTAQAEAAREIFDDEASEESTDGHLTVFGFEEVNYATLEVEDDLAGAGIAYTKKWESGDDYAAGVEHVRFTEDGQVQAIEVYEGGENPPIESLLALCDKPDELVEFIRKHHADCTPLPWDNQVEYGNLYLAKQDQLVTAES